MPELTLRGAVDTWVWSSKDTTRYSDARKLGLASGEAYAYLYFNRPMPLGAVVTSAKLRVYRATSWPSSTVTTDRLGEQLKAARANWNNRPGVTGSGVSTADSGGAEGTLLELDVKTLMQTVADGAPWHGFRLSTSGAALRKLWSSEGASAYRPTLSVEWSEAPHAPTGLTPSGGKAVSTAKPLLRFQSADVLGDTTLAAVRVLVSPTADFAAPWDSGWVTTDLPELDLAATSYPGLASGATAYWKVQVRDGAGLDSALSDDASFSYSPFGAVSILNPASGASPFVSDPTPRILWSYAGTQTRWQVLLLDALNPTEELADSGVRTGTETAWSPLDVDALPTTGPYRAVVRIWDDKNRDPAYAWTSASRDFTVTDDGTVATVSGLAVTQPNPWPGVELTWTRGSAPDSYVVVRDGVTLEPALLPEDVLVSGTSYRYVDPGARVWRPHTWQVKAKVNGKQSASATVSFTPKTRGIWLLDEQNNRRVWLAGQDGGTWERPEEATTLTPIGASQGIRRVQGTRNYQGSLSGQLVDAYGRTAASYELDLEAIRKEGTPVYLAVADLSLKVVLGNVQTAPTAHVPPSRVASFDFWEVS